jgi:hypothetical protein
MNLKLPSGAGSYPGFAVPDTTDFVDSGIEKTQGLVIDSVSVLRPLWWRAKRFPKKNHS